VTQRDPDTLVQLGGWLFKKRTLLPIPIVLALLFVAPPPPGTGLPGLPWIGAALVTLGEMIRLWGVHHIGAISRTRSDRLGPLVASGPFAHSRNPLYIGNALLWLGFTVAARLLWLVPVVFALLAVEYHAIVRWEERLLESRLGDPYRTYMERVPRWLPRLTAVSNAAGIDARFSWRETLFSERGTLIGIAVGCLLLWLKTRLM
jgi:protein-S-isoprenylcysteine O-methyltransferase Ste14